MLNIFYGCETTDREKLIFDHIDPDRDTIIIVPDQASLQMERDALDYFRGKDGRTALLDIMVADFSSLGYKVIKETGGRQPELIDKYGRQMLLSVLIDRLADSGELEVYKNMKARTTFVSNANQLISEMKRCGVTSSDIEQAAGETGSYLSLKLSDINRIYMAYEDSIEGRFTDSEDYIRFYGQLMEDSELIRRSVIWITGFDTFTPLNMEVIQRLIAASEEVNVVMTWDDAKAAGPGAGGPSDARFLTTGEGEGLFDLTALVMDNLKETAEAAGVAWNQEQIPHIHRDSIWEDDPAGKITLVKASNIYAEADRAAACVTELVRDKGYRYRDITVICNDMGVRGGILRRTFERWGIPAFADRKRKVLHQPVVRFLLSFLHVISEGYTDSAVMEMVSAGLMGFSRRDEELLSNYVSEAKIRGTKWKQAFTWEGKDSFGTGRYTDDLERLNEMRAFIVDTIEDARSDIGRRNSAEEKVRGLSGFLEEKFGILDRIEELIARQTELGLAEGAAETAQSWSMICGIFTQVINVIGEENISNRQLRDILTEGLRGMEIGLVPASTDCVIIGTLQRTRISRSPVLIVTAANEGVLPLAAVGGGLLTERELDTLEELKYNIAKKDEVRRQEEQLAIYRMFSLPSDELIVMCSMADQDGRSISPSGVFSVLEEMEGVRKLGDLGDEDITDRIASGKGSLAFMADAMQNYIENGRIDDAWLAAMNWYESRDPDSISKIRQGLDFDNRVQNLEKDFADSLYFGDSDSIRVSASKLEVYGSCPFRYFIEKGLRADEPDAYETSPASRGSVFHMALQRISQRLTDEAKAANLTVTDPESPWMTLSEEDCRRQIDEIIREDAVSYSEGVYLSDNEYRLQLEQIIKTCSDIAWAMIGQVRKSRVKDMYFEESFGPNSRRIPPFEIELEHGRKAVLTGIIDRLDIIDVPEEAGGTGESREAVRVIDYKTGSEEIDLEQIREGYKLQLMIYMNVAGEAAGTTDGAEPAGVFYFKIRDLDEDVGSKNESSYSGESIAERIAKSCRLEGIMVGEDQILRAMDGTIAPTEYSTVLPLKQNKDGGIKTLSNSAMLSAEEFDSLCKVTIDNVRRICRDIQAGRIDIEPKRSRKQKGSWQKNSCTYCPYRSICLFDTSFRNCRYKIIG
ncbi:MAG: PD-(D/E)XK nuclease family protein [Bacillota bacterium]